MPYFLEVPLDDGETVLAEVTEQVDDLVPAGKGRDVIGRLPEALEAGLDRVQAFAGEVLSRMRTYQDPPDVISVEFGLKLTAKAGLVIAESTAEGHLTIGVEWHRPTSQASAEPSGSDDPTVSEAEE